MRNLFNNLLFSIFLVASGAANSTASLIVTNGVLTGATEVDVAGKSYDVFFDDGTCISLYGNCSLFVFGSRAAADLASRALDEQVFLGVYDDNPNLTKGCSDPMYQECQILTAFQSDTASSFLNRSAIWDDSIGLISNGRDTGGYPDLTYAVWSPSVVISPIPEPETYALMLAGLAVVGAAARRRKAQ
jgi:hypothetical protein